MKFKIGDAALMSCALLQSIMLGGEYLERADRLAQLGDRLRSQRNKAHANSGIDSLEVESDVVVSVVVSARERQEMAELLELYSRMRPMSWYSFAMGIGLDQYRVEPEDLDRLARRLREENTDD